MCYFLNTVDIGGSHILFGYLPIYIWFGTTFLTLFAFPEIPGNRYGFEPVHCCPGIGNHWPRLRYFPRCPSQEAVDQVSALVQDEYPFMKAGRVVIVWGRIIWWG
jgi:hypothetical protein